MKRIKKWYSFAGLCVGLLLVYTLSYFVYQGFINYMDMRNMYNAFPDVSSLFEYEDELKNDQYDQIPMSSLPRCSFIVFDRDTGDMVYASDSQIEQNIYYDDLDFIMASMQYENSQSSIFNRVSKLVKDTGQVYYVIDRVEYNEDDEWMTILDRCVLDENYNIIEGSMFAGHDHIGKRELNLMQGMYDKKKIIDKADFVTTNGGQRTVVFVSPALNSTTHSQFLKESTRWKLYSLPIFLVIVFLQILIFIIIVKRSFKPFQRAIVQYRENIQSDFDENTIPMELRQTAKEFKNTVIALEEAKQEKMRTDEERYALITGISHDLKTPLTVIKGFSEALLTHKVPQEKEEKYLRTIYTRASMANNLIDALFSLVKIEHPDFQPDFHLMDLSEYIKQFFAAKYPEIVQNGFCVDLQIPNRAFYCPLDPRLFDRVLENLLENTLKINDKGTTIYISIEKKDQAVKLTVADDGVGIRPDLVDTIFTPFVTGDESRNQGNGLGLAIVKRIVEIHHGQIKAFSHAKYAAQFEITLPLYEC